MTRIHLSPPHMAGRERELLCDAFDSNWIAPLGPHVNAFEQELADRVGVPYAAALSSGTAALHLALQLVGVQAGDEVMTSSLTFAATTNAVRYVGALPVLVDSERRTWNMDPDLLGEALEVRARRGQLPAAVITVDLYGQCADYDAIVPLCQHYGVPLIEDAAEALGATWGGRPAGSFGELGVFSFNGNKIITTSGGGMLVGFSEELIVHARKLATQARDPAPHYQHSLVGYNYRLSNLLAAVGRGQLEILDQHVAARRAHYDAYASALGDLPGVEFMPRDPRGNSNCWLTCLVIDPSALGVDREVIRLHLETLDIESRPVWKPMHLQPAYADCTMIGGAVAEDLFTRGLCLPSGSSLTPNDRERVIAGFRAAAGR